MTDHLALWNAVEKTDPKQVKEITGKPYKGNSPKPYWLVNQATKTFGPCGIGWGFEIVEEKLLDGAMLEPGFYERIHMARIRLWYEWNGKRGTVEHVGQTAFSGRRKGYNDKPGAPFTDEDAPKKSVTDALIKALSMLGFAGDIFMGRFDDSKYVNDLHREMDDAGRDDRFVPNAAARKSSAQAKRDGDWPKLQADLADAQSAVSLQRLWDDYRRNEYPRWKEDWRRSADEEFEKRLADFSQGDDLRQTIEDSIPPTEAQLGLYRERVKWLQGAKTPEDLQKRAKNPEHKEELSKLTAAQVEMLRGFYADHFNKLQADMLTA